MYLTVAVDIHPRSGARDRCPQLLLTIAIMRMKMGSDLPVELPRTPFPHAAADCQSLLKLFNTYIVYTQTRSQLWLVWS